MKYIFSIQNGNRQEEWYGPYDSYEEAYQDAIITMKDVVNMAVRVRTLMKIERKFNVEGS